jgi:hypothetical protein
MMGLYENTSYRNKLENMDWIYLVQETVQWWASVNTAMNFGFHRRRGDFFY